jgi:hypothetical protein
MGCFDVRGNPSLSNDQAVLSAVMMPRYAAFSRKIRRNFWAREGSVWKRGDVSGSSINALYPNSGA